MIWNLDETSRWMGNNGTTSTGMRRYANNTQETAKKYHPGLLTASMFHGRYTRIDASAGGGTKPTPAPNKAGAGSPPTTNATPPAGTPKPKVASGAKTTSAKRK
ncbi:hypothetical protein EDD16DRAFT_1525549 [Pisolithus croceorrhizus]|nr:hypothetical protein EV401DRAFT_1893967 [Pisolithus croceorrhizus]KAI6102582.1 hypothetical protein EDD16DRAFT_1525549 [Pisolithus croceorrhizus]